MNNQLIEKVITSNNEPCPELTYGNPLLDRNVATALSQSFVRILRISNQTSTNNNLRLSVLENIRKMCQVEPENHVKVDENITELLTEVYQDHIRESSSNSADSTEKLLDAFLVRSTKEQGTSSSFKTSHNPEIIQALINLNEKGVYLDALSKEFIHWNVGNRKYSCLLKDIWNNNLIDDSISRQSIENLLELTFDDISIKMKAEIEKLMLEACYFVLTKKDIGNLFSSMTSLADIVGKSSISPNTFQICCGILNFIFVMTNFDLMIQTFIESFVVHVKEACPHKTFSVLYPLHLSNTALLLDFDLNIMPAQMKKSYTQYVCQNVQSIHRQSESDLIMLLSHFPQWFDIYFKQEDV